MFILNGNKLFTKSVYFYIYKYHITPYNRIPFNISRILKESKDNFTTLNTPNFEYVLYNPTYNNFSELYSDYEKLHKCYFKKVAIIDDFYITLSSKDSVCWKLVSTDVIEIK